MTLALAGTAPLAAAADAAGDAADLKPAEAEPVLDETRFAQCLADFRTAALDAEVSATVVDEVLGQVSLSERVLELDRKQPEFTQTFADYFNRRVTSGRG